MAVQIPIISEFDGKGISKAISEFKQLETTGKKAQFALKKAAIPAAAALGAVTAGLIDATKGAIEDAAAADKLAGQLKRVTVNTDAQIAANEDWITSQGQLRAYTDSELRPAIAKLATATGSLEMAQEGATLAMDIATATGKDLDAVTTALAKAYGGNTAALAKLDPGLRDIIKSGADTYDVFKILNSEFGGAAQAAANTAEGSFKRLKISLDETKESIGASLLPIVEQLLPKLNSFAKWAQDNPDTFRNVAGGIAAIAAAIVATNVAMSTNPFVLMAGGIAAVVLAFDKLADAVERINKLGGLGVRLIGYLAGLPQALDIIRMLPGGEGKKQGSSNRSAIPMMAQGGIVTSPTLALIGEAGPEAVVPLNKSGAMGNNITVHVNGGDPNAIVDALRRYMRQSGAVPISVY